MTATGIISGWNPAAVLLYGYPADEIVGRPADVLCPPEGRAGEAAILRRITAGGPPEGYETDRVRKDGTMIRVSLTAGAATGPTGVTGGVTAMSWEAGGRQGHANTAGASPGIDRRTDRETSERPGGMTDAERREAAERREQAQAQAKRLESLGQLAGGVAHDFNNLLAVILNYVSFVTEEVAAASAGEDRAPYLAAASADLAQIEKAAERAVGLTHQLLVFARRDVIRPQRHRRGRGTAAPDPGRAHRTRHPACR
jgi:hypothetical protein